MRFCLTGALSYESPIALFLDLGQPNFWTFYSATPVDVESVVLCEFPLSLCVCYIEDHDQLPIAKYLLYMK